MSVRLVRSAAALGAAVLLLGGACTSKCSGAKCATGPGHSPGATPTTASPSPTGIAAPVWRRISNANHVRQEVAAAIVGGKIYVVGGLITGGGPTDAVEIYDPVSRRWSDAPRLPLAVHHAMAVELNGALMVIGGWPDQLGGAATRRVFILEGTRWREGPSLTRPRAAAAAVRVGNRVFVVGGVSGSTDVGPTEIFDGTSWKDGAPIPSLRNHVAAATDGTFVYAVGGRHNGGHFGTFDRYDPGRDEWKSLPDMPTGRSGLGAAFMERSLVAVGGEGPRIFPEVEAYNLDTGAWRSLPPMPIALHGEGVVAIGQTIYAMLGGTKVGISPTTIAEALTFG